MSFLLKWFESMHMDTEITDECTRKKSVRSTCHKCVDSCDKGALLIIKGQIEIIHNKCTSCGNCVTSCPVSAIKGLVANREVNKNSLVYNSNYLPAVKELLVYKKRGVQSILIEKLPLDKKWSEAIDKTNRILNQLGENPLKVIHDENGKKYSKRDLFISFQTETRQVLKKIVPAEWKVTNQGWSLEKTFEVYQFYSVEIDVDKCSLCQICFSFCPKAVFRLTDSALNIHSKSCVNCLLCQDVCPETSISVKENIKKAEEKQFKVFKKKCEDCGKSFISFKPTWTKCSTCYDRNAGWLSPHI